MLFLLFGSSAAGKSFTLSALRDRVPDLAVHDFDEIGVPPGADTARRHRANEEWVLRALAYEKDGTDFLLAGQTPFGELLATPSAPLVQAISACLLDVDDDTRIGRLRTRGSDWFAGAEGELQDYLSWAAWMRGHASDPTWQPDVIRHKATESEMQWGRWSDWRKGDPRWRVRILDASDLPKERVADELAEWIAEERALVRSANHPLSNWARGHPPRPRG